MVSIVIPYYNAADTLWATIESVLDERDCEIILVDDGSTDDSAKIAAEKTAGRGILISIPHSGVSAARNAGLAQAKGEFVLFLDADDLYPKEITDFIEDLKSYDTIAFPRLSDITELKPLKEGCGRTEIEPVKLMEEYVYDKRKFGMSSFAYKKSILDEFDLKFTEGCRYGEDWEFAIKYLAHCEHAAISDRGYYYRPNPNSVSNNIIWEQTDAAEAAERTSEYLSWIEHPFAERFSEYMYNKALFSIAHRFAKAKNKELYNRLIEEFPVKEAMEFIAGDSKSTRNESLAAKAFLINKNLFFKGMIFEK